MRKVLFLCLLLGLFSMNNAIASEVEKMDVPVEQTDMAVVEDHVDYWVTNVHKESEFGDYYLYFTVHWEYTGERQYPHIAFMVYISDGLNTNSFLDSAIGIKAGSRDYKIKVSGYGSYDVSVNGSDGSPF